METSRAAPHPRTQVCVIEGQPVSMITVRSKLKVNGVVAPNVILWLQPQIAYLARGPDGFDLP